MDTVKAVSFNLLRYSVTIFEQINDHRLRSVIVRVERDLLKVSYGDTAIFFEIELTFSFTLRREYDIIDLSNNLLNGEQYEKI